MPITGHHLDERGRVVYEITTSTPDGVLVENLPADQLMAYDPESVELYQYFYSDGPGFSLGKRKSRNGQIQLKLEHMIIHYMEEEYYDAALDIIRKTVTAGRKPSRQILLSLFDFILRPVVNLRKRTAKELFLMAQEAQRILFYILESFGPDVFNPIWIIFKPNFLGRYHERRKRRETMEMDQDDDDDEPYECSLTEFDDIWDLSAHCFGYVEPRPRYQLPQDDRRSMKEAAGHVRRRMVLDILITVLEVDLRNRRASNIELEKCAFLDMLRKDSTGNRSQFDRYLDIIFSAFGYHSEKDGEPTKLKDASAAEFAGRLLNMLAVLSYCDNLVTPKALVDQTYRRFLKLDVDSCANLIEIIKCTTFLSSICDLYLSDSDCSCVPDQYMHLRNGRNATFLVEKLLHFNMKTRPINLESLEDIYRHVMIVVWRYTLYMNERLIRCDVTRTRENGSRVVLNKQVSSITDEQKIEIIVDGPDALDHWKQHVNEMIKQVNVNNNGQKSEHDQILERQINWTIQLFQLNM
ncbi:hypothetical protein BDA99DRAFT_492974 [Phascolomyces articulosus]|uniref:Uncharacterized protein n=1 Tax=Phascolomyces articulosus TaxID=60185 RepID=A0AAD5PL37_9FUNG|nr:hypothetical protein BDA99DRAFT_492974 [Phascolomyces articulosus]